MSTATEQPTTYPWSPERNRYRLLTVDESPWDALPSYREGGPATVTQDGWCVSHTTGHGITGARLSAFRVLSEQPYVTERHPLDGTTYATTDDSTRAAYEARILARMVFDRDATRYGLTPSEPSPAPAPVPELSPVPTHDRTVGRVRVRDRWRPAYVKHSPHGRPASDAVMYVAPDEFAPWREATPAEGETWQARAAAEQHTVGRIYDDALYTAAPPVHAPIDTD